MYYYKHSKVTVRETLSQSQEIENNLAVQKNSIKCVICIVKI